MSPEASKPENNTQIGSERFQEGLHPTDGVRPFKQGDLPDVHESLLGRGVPEVSQIDPHTLEVAVDKVPLTSTETTEKKSKALKIGGAIGAVILAGGAALGIGTMNNEAPTRETTSASPENEPSSATGENEAPDAGNGEMGENPTDSSIIENLTRPSTEEQITYVLENPVSVEEFPNARDAIVELGKRMSVIFHTDPESLSPEENDALYAAVYDASSPAYQTLKDSMDERRTIVSGEYVLFDSNFEATFALEPTDIPPTTNVAGVGVNADIIYSGNGSVYENMGYNKEAAEDYNANFTIKQINGEWRLFATDSHQDLGDIK